MGELIMLSVRRVATEAGSKRFKKPIGALISNIGPSALGTEPFRPITLERVRTLARLLKQARRSGQKRVSSKLISQLGDAISQYGDDRNLPTSEVRKIIDKFMPKDKPVELAGRRHGVRVVRTLQGAKYYGEPIGTVITQDMIDAKKRAKATAPGPNQRSATAGTAEKELSVVPYTGPEDGTPINVGGSKMSVPRDSKIFKFRGGAGVAYILKADGTLNVLNKHGEVRVDPNIADRIKQELNNNSLFEALGVENNDDGDLTEEIAASVDIIEALGELKIRLSPPEIRGELRAELKRNIAALKKSAQEDE